MDLSDPPPHDKHSISEVKDISKIKVDYYYYYNKTRKYAFFKLYAIHYDVLQYIYMYQTNFLVLVLVFLMRPMNY